MERVRLNNFDALAGVYRTPRSDSGISATMTTALKITADRMADCGLCSRMMFSRSRPGNSATNIAGMIAKYLAMSLAIENVVNAPRVISSCLQIGRAHV